MEQLWSRIENRLAELGCLEAMALRPGADPQTIANLEQRLGVALPESVKRFLAIHDGQDGNGLVFGYTLLSVAAIEQQWNGWRELDEEEMNADCADSMGSEPAGVIKPMYCNPGWIPLTHDYGGNHFGIDVDPDTLGQSGQVIAFGRDEDIKRLLANSFPEYVETLIAWLERARWNGSYLDADE